MKNDIDFDELDRAVSSLMGGATVKAEDETPQSKTLSITTTLKPDEGPSYEKLDEVAKKIGSETVIADDDTTRVKDLGEISHTEPQSIAINGTTAPVLPSEEQKSVAAIPAATRPSSGRFMDVVHPSSDMKSPGAAPQPKTPEQPATVQSTSVAKNAPLASIELTSPFITDAKVDKRPLGDPFADPTPQGKELSQAEIGENDAPEEIVAINSEALARVEASKDTQSVLDATKIDATTDAIDQQLQAIESIHAEPVPSTVDASLRAVESVDTANAKGAAPQGGQPQGAIYDVKEYHQPLNHPPKRKSGWGVVVIIVIIIILAAAIGAGAFFLLGLGN